MDSALQLRFGRACAASQPAGRLEPPRQQSGREEFANALSHAVGIALALLAWPILTAAGRGTATQPAAGIFCAALVLQYAASTACHAWPQGRLGAQLQRLDHAAIYILIAGTVTPFLLGRPDAGSEGALRCALVWTLALAGAALKLSDRLTERGLSTLLYVLFGAGAVVSAWPVLGALEGATLGWLALGIAAYLVGTGFFLADSVLRYGHLVWHLFVLAGSACHVAAVAAAPSIEVASWFG
jgi:hemolysin III